MTLATGMNWPKISIITPSFNQGRYLEDCIQSILSQNYPNLEYFIIDGGSKDQSIDIIKNYEQQLSGWISEPDEGQSDAINKGMKRASGDLIAWLNTDDYYLPGALQTIARSYQQHPMAPFHFGNGLRVDAYKSQERQFYETGEVSFDRPALIFGLNYILQPATFIRRASLEKIGYLDVNLHYAMDTDLWLRLSEQAEPKPVQAMLAASREHGSTKTATGSFKRLEELRQVAEKYSGAPITPGYLCYFFDTLERFTKEHEDIYPSAYRKQLIEFWSSTGSLLTQYNARPDGFPIQPTSNQQTRSASAVNRLHRVKKKFMDLIGKRKV